MRVFVREEPCRHAYHRASTRPPPALRRRLGMSNDASPAPPPLTIQGSRHFPAWLAQTGCSLGFSTYQAGKVFLVGTEGQELRIAERTFARCMGLAAREDRFYLASQYQLWRFNDVLDRGSDYQGYDGLFIPHLGWTTGDVDAHDIGIRQDGRPVFVNTLFSCLAAPSDTENFEVVWQPPFVTRLAPEDRCHLNGLAMRDGEPGWVTAVARSDVAEGWRDHRENGGIVMAVESGEVVCEGLSMPHSPRWDGRRLWVLNSGTGYLGEVNLQSGQFEPLCFLPGFARGMALIGNHAIIGLSKPRSPSFGGLPLSDELKERNAEPRCGLVVVDLEKGDLIHHLRIDGIIEELFDVMVLPERMKPTLLGFKTDEIKHMVRFS